MTAAAHAWPPAHMPLAARIFPERADAAETWLDTWAAGVWLSRPKLAGSRARERERFVAAALRHAEGLADWDDARLRRATRIAAAAAFMQCDEASGAQALALVREAARRTLGLLAHPPQMLAAWKLLCGRLIELDTGEGKTLTAGLAACLAALAGVPAHVVTVNDYLAQRDAQKMGPLFDFFGLSVGVVHSGVAQSRRAAEYQRNLTYCTNKDLVFDYLRDRVNSHGVHSLAQLSVRQLGGLARSTEPLRLRGLHFAIVDEADSILIDEARTPLILSAAKDKGSNTASYRQLLQAAERLELKTHYRLVGPQRSPELTDAGRELVEEMAAEYAPDTGGAEPGEGGDAPSAGESAFWQIPWVREHYIVLALRALHVFHRDHHYVVNEGKVVIVDEFTGRLLPDRSWEQGLHQLVEVKEGCEITGVNVTLARLTYQAFFARYLRLSGMSGTLREVARETAGVYRVRSERVEPNKPSRRVQLPSRLLFDRAAHQAAVVQEVQARLAAGQPVLVGTRSVQASQAVSAALQAAGVAHSVLNALQTADEAELVAQAGSPGAVTVATNMAGRGTDIPLHPAVVGCGGLHVLLTEWHESARIDRQLFGRCARQGDPGSCRAIVCIEDEVIQRHGTALAGWFMRRWGGSQGNAGPSQVSLTPSGGGLGAARPRGRSATEPPQWAITLLRRAAQAMAERVNAGQRRATLTHDRHMRTQLAFSGTSE